MYNNTLKQRMLAGENIFGSFVMFESPDIVELYGMTGFDFVIIDNEHGPCRAHSDQEMVRAAQLRGIAPIIRVPDASSASILKALDIGAAGVQVPQVNDVATAKLAVQNAHYYPEGIRGIAGTRALEYGMKDLAAESLRANDENLVICHCETVQCFEQLDTIAAIDGIDVIFVGPYDLSQSLGIPGQVHAPQVLNIIESSIKTIKKHGKIGGIYCGSVQDTKERLDMGYQYIGYSTECGLLSELLSGLIKQLKGL